MIIYLHGFNSSGKSEKARELGRLLSEIELLSPDIPSDLELAVPFLEDLIQQHADEPLMLIGSSLGGYLAQYLGRKFGCPIVLINPALHPVPLLMQHLGKQVNYYSGKEYELTESSVQSLACYAVEAGQDHHPTLVLLDKADELLDSAATAKAYEGHAQVVAYEGGSHRFDHLSESAPVIRQFYQNSVLKR